MLLEVEPAELKAAHRSGIIQNVDCAGNLSLLKPARACGQEAGRSRIKGAAGFRAIGRHRSRGPPPALMGSGITLWSGYKGASCLASGASLQKRGKKAAEELILELKSGASVDVHLADQLIPYLALAGGSYTSREISLHARTNIWTAEHFLERKISLSGEGIIKLEA